MLTRKKDFGFTFQSRPDMTALAFVAIDALSRGQGAVDA